MARLASLALLFPLVACFHPTGLPEDVDGSAAAGRDAATPLAPDASLPFRPDAATPCTGDSDCPAEHVCAPSLTTPGDCTPRCVPGCHLNTQCASNKRCVFSGTSPSCICSTAPCAGTCGLPTATDAGIGHDAAVPTIDAGACIGEGSSINRTGNPNPPHCCPGLSALPQLAEAGNGTCQGPACDCVVCTSACGSGTCSSGKNPCNCAKDCPKSLPKGPGSKCTTGSDCAFGSTCFPASYSYPTGGYCMGSTCDPSASPSTCPAGTICTPLRFSQALGHCMPACRSDGDCRSDLTCEWMVSYMGPSHGTYICWQDKAGGAALGKACTQDQDCLSMVCMAKPSTGTKVCSAYCDDYTPCKLQQTCVPLGGCGSVPGCGGCF